MVKNVLAIDLGASSGRAIVGSYEKGTLKIFEVHRFANEPVENEEGLFWNFPRILEEVKKGIKKAADELSFPLRYRYLGRGFRAFGCRRQAH
jgi:sugar (pentulose or hexulose) kinase